MITPPVPADVLARLPGLAALGRTATRLHPRPAVVTALDSHVGGPLRWPTDEPWPTCDTPYVVREEVPIPTELVARLDVAEARRTARHVLAEGEVEVQNEIARLVGPGFTGWGSTNGGPIVGHRYVSRPHPRPNPMVALAQLRAADVPDLPRPGGADLLQVLWCPFEHKDTRWGPCLRLHWRREADPTEILAEPPRGDVGNDNYLPRPCRLHPEQIVEYPYPQELPDELRELVDAWEDEEDGDYVDTFMAPGWKVGGHAKWNVTDLLPTPCPRCAGPTRLTLAIASSEYDGGSRDRWRPVEAQGVDWSHPDRHLLQLPTDITVSRWGTLRVFVCLTCPDTPVHLDIQ